MAHGDDGPGIAIIRAGEETIKRRFDSVAAANQAIEGWNRREGREHFKLRSWQPTSGVPRLSMDARRAAEVQAGVELEELKIQALEEAAQEVKRQAGKSYGDW